MYKFYFYFYEIKEDVFNELSIFFLKKRKEEELINGKIIHLNSYDFLSFIP